MLKINNISVFYGKTRVLWDLSVNVGKKETIAIIGSNSAGKTTLLKAIMGIQPPQNGNIIFKGEHIEKLPTEEIVNRGLILIPEGDRIFPSFSVLENLNMGAYVRNDKQLEERFQWVYKLFPLLEVRKKQIAGTLSGGQRKMLAIGRGLIQKPDLLIIDEPSLGLAPEAVTRLFKSLEKIKEMGIPMIIVEQNVYLSLKFSDRGYVIENGKIIAEDNSDKLLKSGEIKKAYLT
jgi:branched-chain amino acid transport system ATP-binding protein